jgi:hypothetical protein
VCQYVHARVLAHDVEELEWVSRIMDDSLAELPWLPLSGFGIRPHTRGTLMVLLGRTVS